jgi:hypothetical protein
MMDRPPHFVHANRPALLINIDMTDPKTAAFITPAFDRIEGPEFIPVTSNGIVIRTIPIYRAFGFKGFPLSSSEIY